MAYVGTGMLAILAVGALLGFLLADVVDEWVLRTVDRPLIEGVVEDRTRTFDDVMIFVTHIGDNVTVGTTLTLLALVMFLMTRDPRFPSFLFTTMGGALAVSNVLKPLVERPRPYLEPLVNVGGFSWPSGHAVAAATLWFSIGFLASRNVEGRARVLVWVVTTLPALAIAFSRVYLGVHWPTDVVGGLAAGAAWIVVTSRATGLVPPRRAILVGHSGRRGRVV